MRSAVEVALGLYGLNLNVHDASLFQMSSFDFLLRVQMTSPALGDDAFDTDAARKAERKRLLVETRRRKRTVGQQKRCAGMILGGG